MTTRMTTRTIAAAALLVLLAAGCGPGETPDSQVRAVIARGEQAAEARDLSGLMDLVSPKYQDGHGETREDLKQTLRGYLVTHQSIHLLVKVDSVEFPYRDMAKVSLTLGTLGREAPAPRHSTSQATCTTWTSNSSSTMANGASRALAGVPPPNEDRVPRRRNASSPGQRVVTRPS